MKNKKNGYIAVLPQMLEVFKNNVAKDIERYRLKGLPKAPKGYYERLEARYRDIAIGEIMVNGNMVEAKKCFYIASMIRIIMMKKISQENYLSGHFSYRACFEEEDIYMALLSDNQELIKLWSELSCQRKSSEKDTAVDEKFICNLLYALKNILLEKFEYAKINIEEIQSLKDEKYMKNYIDIGNVLEFLLNKDEEGLNISLENMAKAHRKLNEYKDTPNETLSLRTLGLAKLAQNLGLKVSFVQSTAPLEILKYIDIEYPKIDFVD